MKAFNDGEIVDQGSLRLPLNSITSAMGLLIFDAMRCYTKNGTDAGLYAFRLADHHRRLTASLRALNVEVPMSCIALRSAIAEVLRANAIENNCYLKVMVYWDQELAGTSLFDLSTMRPKMAIIASVTTPAFFDGMQELRCCISSWRRINEEAMPPSIKASANYFNARLELVDAIHDGYDNAIFLDQAGRISEAAESNVFLIRRVDNTMVTPSVTSSILPGITRDTIIRVMRDAGKYRVEEREVNRAETCAADAVFLTNTAQLIRNVTEIDGRRFDRSATVEVSCVRQALLDVLFQKTLCNEEWFCRVA